MTEARRALGAAGEAAACAHLEQRGYRIVARNARADRVELDIVAERGGVLVFVEVKTRRRELRRRRRGGRRRKQARIVRGAAAWLRASGHRARRVRFDVVTCEPAGADFRVTHWEAAFDARE